MDTNIDDFELEDPELIDKYVYKLQHDLLCFLKFQRCFLKVGIKLFLSRLSYCTTINYIIFQSEFQKHQRRFELICEKQENSGERKS